MQNLNKITNSQELIKFRAFPRLIRLPSGSENQSFRTPVKAMPRKYESSTAVTLPDVKYAVRVYCDESF
jgi:hypothetical protein